MNAVRQQAKNKVLEYVARKGAKTRRKDIHSHFLCVFAPLRDIRQHVKNKIRSQKFDDDYYIFLSAFICVICGRKNR